MPRCIADRGIAEAPPQPPEFSLTMMFASATKKPPALGPSLLVCASAALWIDLSSIHQSHHADSLLPALVSLYRWTPFYWELDRIGMLVPLIACPVKHPLANLLLQDFFYLFGGLAALFLLPRYVLRDATYPAVGALSVAAFVALTPPYYRFEYLIDTQYGIWLSLGLSGLILLEPNARGVISPPRRTAAVLLVILAHWCYCTASLYLGPLVVFRCLAFRRERFAATSEQATSEPSVSRGKRWLRRWACGECVTSLATLAIGFATGLALMRLAPIRSTDFGGLPVDQWWRSLRELCAGSWRGLSPQWWPLCLAACGAGGAIVGLLPAARCGAKPWRGAAALTGAACAVGAFLATRHWAGANGYNFRFLLVPALFVQAALIALAVGPLAALRPSIGNRLGTVLMAAVVLLSAAYVFGRPSLDRVRRQIAGAAGATGESPPRDIRTTEVVASGCTHVAGDYWKVWPMVFRTNLALFESGERRSVWGITERSGPTSRYWTRLPRSQVRVAVAAGDDEPAQVFLARYGLLPLTVAQRCSSLNVLAPAELLKK